MNTVTNYNFIIMKRVNKILSGINKKYIIAAGSLFLMLIAGSALLKTTLNVIFPGNEVSNQIKEGFRTSFGKAVKFDSMYFKYNGDIVLLNFSLSNTIDFNDNINLLKCDEVIIDTDLLGIIRRKITFSGINMDNAEFNLIKNYGKRYSNIITESITSGIDREIFNDSTGRSFTLAIEDAHGVFRDNYRNGKTVIEFDDLDATFRYRKESIHYTIDGEIINKDRSFFNTGNISANGSINAADHSAKHHFAIDKFNLILLNEFVRDNNITGYSFEGYASTDIYITTKNGTTSIYGGISLDDLRCVRAAENSESVICKNEDISAEFNIAMSENLDIVKASKIFIEDGVIELTASFEYEAGKSLLLKMKSNDVRLDRLSKQISPFRNCDYSGSLTIDCNMHYNLNTATPDDISMNLTLANFNLIPKDTLDTPYRQISNCNSTFSLTGDRILFSTNFKTGTSDLSLDIATKIKGWAPFSSDTSMTFNSGNLELGLFNRCIENTVEFIYEEAFTDMFQNFDEQRNFLKEPEGIFINNNNLSLKISADKLSFTDTAYLQNFNILLTLDKGYLKTDEFSLEGYSGKYSMDFTASLRQEYPFFRVQGSASDVDLGLISRDSGLPYNFSGILSFDYRFETNAFRVGQIIENGNASINVEIRSGSLKNHAKQNEIQSNFTLNGFAINSLNDMVFDSFKISFLQSGNTFYFRNVYLGGPNFYLGGYGKYSREEQGVDLPLNLQVSEGGSIIKVPLQVSGNLLAPCVKVKAKTAKESVCF